LQLGKKAHVQIQTSHGNINVELHCDIAMRTCWNFIELSQRGYYNNTSFHRLVPGFMVQGGDPTGTGTGGTSAWGNSFKDEFDNRIWHETRGVLSMANSGPNTNKSQFFITFAKTEHLNNMHSVFGRVVGGMATLDRIEAVGADSKEKPLGPITINEIVVFTNPVPEADAILMDEIKARMSARKRSSVRSALPGAVSAAVDPIPAGSKDSAVTAGRTAGVKATRKLDADEPVEAANDDAAVAAFLGHHSSQHQGSDLQAKKKAKGFGNFSSW
jgi:peptidyl-prolyl cis-trans isomerase-like protein 2